MTAPVLPRSAADVETLPWTAAPRLDLDARHVRRLSDHVPDWFVAGGKALYEAYRTEIPPQALKLAYAVDARTGWRFGREAKAYARLVGADWREILVLNVSYDFTMKRLGCSTTAVATARGPVLARNLDWAPADLLSRATAQVRFTTRRGHGFTHAAVAGGIGVTTGLSDRGFAFALNATTCDEGVNHLGYPVTLFLRSVIETAEDFADAKRKIVTAKLAAPAIITLVGTSNDERVVIERTPTKAVCREPDRDEPLVATNHYRKLDGGVGLGSDAELDHVNQVQGRYGCLLDAMTRASADPTDAEFLFDLTDPGVLQDITAQHIVARPASGDFGTWVPSRYVTA
ncbi:MAG: C45 family peptidase [Planctomycetota bacterium]